MLHLLKFFLSYNDWYGIGFTTAAIKSQIRLFDAKQIMLNLAALVRLLSRRDEALDEIIYPFLEGRITVSFFHISFRELLEGLARRVRDVRCVVVFDGYDNLCWKSKRHRSMSTELI